MNVTARLAEWATQWDGAAPESARRWARDAIYDTVACMIAGAGDDGANRTRGALAGWGGGAPGGTRRGEHAGRFSRRQQHGSLNARQAILLEAQHVLIGRAPQERRRGRVGGVALRCRGRIVGGAIIPKQQHLVQRHGNVFEHAAEGGDDETVPIIGSKLELMRRRRRRTAIRCADSRRRGAAAGQGQGQSRT